MVRTRVEAGSALSARLFLVWAPPGCNLAIERIERWRSSPAIVG
jgi:hypothetical protein